MYDFDQHNDDYHRYDDKSGGQMLLEICRLLLLLIVSLLRWCLRWLLKGLHWLLKWTCKGLLALIDLSVLAVARLRAFWNDNDTQEKLRKMRAWLLRTARLSWHYTRVGARAVFQGLLWLSRKTWQGLSWLSKATVRSILHLGPTLAALWRGLCRLSRLVWQWMRRVWTAFVGWLVRRRDAYRAFRQNKGFRGLLIDIGNWLKHLISNYLDEQPALESDEVESEESLFETDEYEAEDEHVHTFGRSIYNAMKRIVED